MANLLELRLGRYAIYGIQGYSERWSGTELVSLLYSQLREQVNNARMTLRLLVVRTGQYPFRRPGWIILSTTAQTSTVRTIFGVWKAISMEPRHQLDEEVVRL